jgi:hypothetical protein
MHKMKVLDWRWSNAPECAGEPEKELKKTRLRSRRQCEDLGPGRMDLVDKVVEVVALVCAGRVCIPRKIN